MIRSVAALLTAALLSVAAAHATVRTESGLSESKVGVTETYRVKVVGWNHARHH